MGLYLKNLNYFSVACSVKSLQLLACCCRFWGMRAKQCEIPHTLDAEAMLMPCGAGWKPACLLPSRPQDQGLWTETQNHADSIPPLTFCDADHTSLRHASPRGFVLTSRDLSWCREIVGLKRARLTACMFMQHGAWWLPLATSISERLNCPWMARMKRLC